MPAFSHTQIYALQASVEALGRRALAHQAAGLILTIDEVLNMFAPPEHHHILKTMEQVAYCYPSKSFNARWRSGEHVAGLQFEFHGSCAAPRDPRFREGEQPEAEKCINVWLQQRIGVGLEFGRVQTVLAKLNDMCVSPKQVRFLWPTVATLASGEEMAPLRDKLAAGGKPPSSIPSVTPALREAMERAAGTIAGATLLGDPPQRFTSEVTVTIQGDISTNEEIGIIKMVK